MTFRALILGLAVTMLIACTEERRYQGHDVPFHRGPFVPYQEDCRNHSATLDPDTALWVERLLLAAPVPEHLPTRDLSRVTAALKVPGYGLSYGGSSPAESGRARLVRIEVPCRGKDRILTFIESAATLVLVDDFSFGNAEAFLATVELDGPTLVYRDPAGRIIVRRQQRGHAPPR